MATEGYLFQSLLAATQARHHAPGDTEVYLTCLADSRSDETSTIASAARSAGVEFVMAPTSALEGLHPKFGRLTIDLAVPSTVDQVLYLDGDTQVVGDLTPILSADLGPRTALAARDPMVFLRDIRPSLRPRVDRWFEESGIPPETRPDYINSGVLRTTTDAIRDLRGRLRGRERQLSALRFQDQDAINLVWGSSIGIVSASWNFPGFLLGSAASDVVAPRILHFMSEPRPWEAALPPWGRALYEPYAQLVADHPGLVPYWVKHTPVRRARYAAQQFAKAIVEGRSYRTREATRVFTELERTVIDLD